MKGKYCPSIEHGPQTPEGLLVKTLGLTAGLWERAGQSGTLVGLKWDAALALISDALDRDRIIHLLRCWEGGMITGAIASAKAAEVRRQATDAFNRGQGAP